MRVSDKTTTVMGTSARDLANLIADDGGFDFLDIPSKQLSELYAAGAWWEHTHRPGIARLHALIQEHRIPYIVYYTDNKLGDPLSWVTFGKGSLPIMDTTMFMIFDALITSIRRSGAAAPASIPPMFWEMRDTRTRERLHDWQRVVQGMINMGQHNRGFTLLHKPTTPGRWNFLGQVYATVRDPLRISLLVAAGFSQVKGPEQPLHHKDLESARRMSDRHYQSFIDLQEWLNLFPVDYYSAVEVSGVVLTGPPAPVGELVALLQRGGLR